MVAQTNFMASKKDKPDPRSAPPEAKPAEKPTAEVEPPEPDGGQAPDSTVPEGSAKEVLTWVNGDKEKAQAALDAENDGQKRVGLSGQLEALLKDDEPEDDDEK